MQKRQHRDVHHSLMYHGEKLEATCTSIHEGSLNKGWYSHKVDDLLPLERRKPSVGVEPGASSQTHVDRGDSHLQNVTWDVCLRECEQHGLCVYKIVLSEEQREAVTGQTEDWEGPGIGVCVGFPAVTNDHTLGD